MGDNNLLFESVFKRKLSATDTPEYLTKITTEHPYFSPAQFFLLLLSESGTPAYEKQAAKTSILFNNAWWLQFQLQENRLNTEATNEIIEPKEPQVVPPESETLNEVHGTDLNDIDFTSETGTGIQSQIIATFPDIEPTSIKEETGDLQPEKIVQPVTEYLENDSRAEENMVPENENMVQPTITTTEVVMIFDENPVQQEEALVGENQAVPIEISVSPIAENGVEKIKPLQSGHFNNDPSPLENEPELEESPGSEQEILPINFKLNIEPVATTEDLIIFEPLHTTDYFASLGIKLSGEIQPADKLGKQLKSFTEWLKTMKKIHPGELPPQSPATDISIQNLAEQSNKEGETVTEAMAEVLLHQGKVDKAVEVYKKLSLLNPSKSAFFAAKIDQLKEH